MKMNYDKNKRIRTDVFRIQHYIYNLVLESYGCDDDIIVETDPDEDTLFTIVSDEIENIEIDYVMNMILSYRSSDELSIVLDGFYVLDIEKEECEQVLIELTITDFLANKKESKLGSKIERLIMNMENIILSEKKHHFVEEDPENIQSDNVSNAA